MPITCSACSRKSFVHGPDLWVQFSETGAAILCSGCFYCKLVSEAELSAEDLDNLAALDIQYRGVCPEALEGLFIPADDVALFGGDPAPDNHILAVDRFAISA
jgi:hypothetical protein